MNNAYKFSLNYQDSRENFLSGLDKIAGNWSNAQLFSYQHHDGLCTDWIIARAKNKNAKSIIITTGEHGIETYVGAAMLDLFTFEFLPQLDPDNTQLLFVHAINPWGMANFRRVNKNNVDLNRNFLLDPEMLDPEFNPEFSEYKKLLSPSISHLGYIEFWTQIIFALIQSKGSHIKHHVLLGQYRYPNSIYFGGITVQGESQLMIKLYREIFSLSSHVVHFDMHTGYGPRYQMALVNSPHEPRSSIEVSKDYGYPLVVSTTEKEFYALRGDMVDLVYELKAEEFPNLKLYSTSFEFGTYGDSIFNQLKSLKSLIFENAAFHLPVMNEKLEKKIRSDFLELFFPQEVKWQQKAISDARQAFCGILRGEGFI